MKNKIDKFSGNQAQTSLGKKTREKTKIKDLIKKDKKIYSYMIDTMQFIEKEMNININNQN